eukprot:TRINITY_DN10006_c0_g1_i3.p1 TRINITY_DN10006_c0_g1~~TRINITY_DN10006_c0_g1_i3.p1  ORF type:complete len:371 (+),score=63.67 TRINITY_DN10006_c0_g1_i3:102-1115(+)
MDLEESLPLVSKSVPGPPAILVHGGVMLAYACFGGGSVVSKFGVMAVNPLIFELVREVAAGVLLCAFAAWKGSSIKVRRADLGNLFTASFLFFIGQLCYFVGLALTDPMAAALWSGSAPVFVTLLAAALGYQSAKRHQALGIVVTVLGATGIPFMDSLRRPASFATKPLGHLFFAVCIASQSTYILVSSKLTKKYEAVPIAGLVFVCSSCFFALTTWCVLRMRPLLEVLCSNVESTCVTKPWQLNEEMLPPLAYEVLMCSCVAWALLAWSTCHAKPLVSSIYVAVQPVTAAALSEAIVKLRGVEWSNQYSIYSPQMYHFIGIGMILSGLVMTFSHES